MLILHTPNYSRPFIGTSTQNFTRSSFTRSLSSGSTLPNEEEVNNLIENQSTKSSSRDSIPEFVRDSLDIPSELPSGNNPSGIVAEETIDIDNGLSDQSASNELKTSYSNAQLEEVVRLMQKVQQESQAPTEAAVMVEDSTPNYVSFLEPSSPILPDQNRSVSDREVLLSEQNITNFAPDNFYESIRLFMKNKIRAFTIAKMSKSDISSYLKNFSLSYTYSICSRIVDSLMAVGYASGEMVFSVDKNVRFLNTDYSRGVLGAISEYILSLPCLFLLTKINDSSFTSAMSKQAQSKFRFPQIYAQIAHDINSSNEVTQISVDSDDGSYTANVRLKASISDNLSCITSSCMTISFMMAKWAFDFLEKPMNRTYGISRLLTDNVSSTSSDTDRQLNSNNPVSVLRTLLHDSLLLDNLTSNDPKRFSRALASLYSYQTTWYNYCGVKNYLHCSPYEFITFRSSVIKASPVMFGAAVESGEFAITSRFTPPSELEMNFFMLYSITLNPDDSTKVVQDFMSWNYRYSRVNYSTRLVGKQSFLKLLMSMQHGNDQEMTWPVAYDSAVKNIVLTPSSPMDAPKPETFRDDGIAAAAFIGEDLSSRESSSPESLTRSYSNISIEDSTETLKHVSSDDGTSHYYECAYVHYGKSVSDQRDDSDIQNIEDINGISISSDNQRINEERNSDQQITDVRNKIDSGNSSNVDKLLTEDREIIYHETKFNDHGKYHSLMTAAQKEDLVVYEPVNNQLPHQLSLEMIRKFVLKYGILK